jgi:hypothetical protein
MRTPYGFFWLPQHSCCSILKIVRYIRPNIKTNFYQGKQSEMK